MRKRLFSLLLVVFMVLTVVPVTVFAEETGVDVDTQFIMQFSVDEVTVGNDDETVEVNVNVAGNGGFAAMNYQLVFDKNALILEEQPTVNPNMGFEFAGGPLDNALESGKHLGMLVSEENVYRDGVLLTYTFRIAPDAKAGSYSVRIFTDGVVNLPDGTKINLEILDDSFVSMQSTTKAGYVSIPGYKVVYDANGGTGAPESQTKSKNDFVYISSAIPERSGYSFLGWAKSANAEKADYEAGDKYSENADVTLYAVWKKDEIIAGEIGLSIGSLEAKPGDEIEVPISISGNRGINALEFDLLFDNTKLKYVGSGLKPAPDNGEDQEAEPYTLDKFMFIPFNPDAATDSVGFAFVAVAENLLGNGEFAFVKFKVLETAEDGVTGLSLVPKVATQLYGSAMEDAKLEVNSTNGSIEITSEGSGEEPSQLLGDANLDGTVDINDAILVLQYSMFPDDYPIYYQGGVDFTKDGSVDINDAILLLQYSMFPDDYPIA